MPLVRVASGLLARHEAGSATHPFEPADWTGPSGVTFGISGGALTISGNPIGWRAVRRAAASTIPRTLVQVAGRSNLGLATWISAAAHIDSLTDPDVVALAGSIGRTPADLTTLVQFQDGVQTALASQNVPARSANTVYRFSVAVDGQSAAGCDHGNELVLTGAPTRSVGYPGILLGRTAAQTPTYTIVEYYECADRYLRVTGLPAGYSVRIGELVEAAAGGEAVFDLLAVALPLASDTIEVLDGSGNVVAALTPDGGVWGGDEYEFSGEPENPWEPCPPPPATEWGSCDGAGVPESDIRERQPEFATPTHEVVGASIIRRPDAISLDYLTAHTLGPIAVADPSRGLVARVWKAWTPDGYEVRLAGANGAGDAWTDEVILFTIDDGGPPITELDIAFEQNGQPVVCLERPTGTGGAPEVWIWFYDPTVPGMVLQNFGPGRTPRALLDRPLDVADSDVCVFYVADHAGRIAYRQQRDRYAVEILTPFEATEDTCLEDAAKMQDRRVVLILSERDQISGTYSLRTATTTLSPLAADTEAVEPIHGITAATLEQVFRWLDTQMHPEAIEPVHSLVSARLQEPIILYALAGEAIEPAHSLTGITLRDLILVYAATTEAVAPAHMIAHATLVVAITIDRVLDTEAVEPAHTITSIELQAA